MYADRYISTIVALLLVVFLGIWAYLLPPGPARPTNLPILVVDTHLNDVAAAYPATREIRINPYVMALYEPRVVTFLLEHEQWHLILNHSLTVDSAARVKQELEADCFAARNVSPLEVEAAYTFFLNRPYASPLHPDGRSRALYLAHCSLRGKSR